MIWTLSTPLPATDTDRSSLQAHQSTYAVRYNGDVIGEIDFILEPANERVWHVKTQTRAVSQMAKLLGTSVTEASHFYWGHKESGRQLIPLTYHQVSREPLRTRYWQHHFDWSEMTASTITHEGEQTIPLLDGLVDPLTLRLQLAERLHDPSQRGIDHEFVVLDRDDVENQRIEARGSETISVPAGCFQTDHYYRFRKPDSARNYDLWVSEALDWLPVKMVQVDGKRTITIELVESTLLANSPDC